MSSKPPSSRESRRQAAREQQQRAQARRRWLLPAIGGGLIAVAAIVAIVLANGSSRNASPAPSAGASGSAAAVSSPAPGRSATGDSGTGAGDPVVTGASLVPLPQSGADPAVGQTIPTVTTATGDIALDGRPKAILFFAHWCPHCQAELPRVQAWIAGGGLPSDVDFVSVSTGIDPSRPNYPPEPWLASIGWTPPVLSDTTNAIAGAYGLTFYPFWTFVNADGTVSQRLVGELTTDQIDAAVAALER